MWLFLMLFVRFLVFFNVLNKMAITLLKLRKYEFWFEYLCESFSLHYFSHSFVDYDIERTSFKEVFL